MECSVDCLSDYPIDTMTNMDKDLRRIVYNSSPNLIDVLVRRPFLMLLVSLGMGALQVLAFAPFNLWYLIFPSVGYLLWCWECFPARRAMRLSYWYGLGFWLASVHWITNSFTHFASASIWLSMVLVLVLALCLALLWPLHFQLYSMCTRNMGMFGYLRTPVWLKALLFASTWIVIEWLRSTIFQGFPWLLLGYSLMDLSLPLRLWLPIGGIWSLSFLAALTIAGVYFCLHLLINSAFSWRSMSGYVVGLLGMPLLLILVSMTLPTNWSEPTGTTLRMALVQPSIPLVEKWDAALVTRNILLLNRLSKPYADHVDVVLWPESAIVGDWKSRSRLLGSIARGLQPATLVSGTLRVARRDDGRSGVLNSLGRFTAEPPWGSNFYDKRQLVPFGEFVPFGDQLYKLIRYAGFPASSISASSNYGGDFAVGAIDFSASICYEAIFPALINRDAWQKSALLNISDDGWFGKSIGPEQHFQMARGRALEQSRQLVRLGNDGITALVDHQGRIVHKLKRFVRDVLVVDVQARSGRTPFSYLGDFVVLVLALPWLLIYLVMAFLLRSKIE